MLDSTLDRATENAVNNLGRSEVLRLRTTYGLAHEVLNYGLDAVAHAYVMRIAEDVTEGNLPVDQFIKKYRISFVRRDSRSRCRFPLSKLEADGIFVPDYRAVKSCTLFDNDYLNKFTRHSKVLSERFDREWLDEAIGNAHSLIYGDWSAESFEDSTALSQGLKFAQDLWTISIDGFERHQEELEKRGINRSERQQHLRALGKELIAYYNQVVNAPNP
ncbi:MAG: hypothetical protein ABH824_05905 [Nanoarchaeota archaeon]